MHNKSDKKNLPAGILGELLSIGLLLFLMSTFDLKDLSALLKHTEWHFVIYASLAYFINNPVSGNTPESFYEDRYPNSLLQ